MTLARRIMLGGLVAAGLLLTMGASAGLAAPAPPAPVIDETGPSLVQVPAGCGVPDPADVAFTGTATAKDFEKVRYRIEQIRAGTASQYSIDGLVDVLYLDDAKFVEVGETYLVGARFDPEFGQLVSAIRPAEPLFGGNDVIGLEDTDVECPVLDDPVRTVNPDGTSVDSGVLSPLFEDKSTLLATAGVPTVIAFAVIIALVLLKSVLASGTKGVVALGRLAVTPEVDQKAIRVRRHRRDDPE